MNLIISKTGLETVITAPNKPKYAGKDIRQNYLNYVRNYVHNLLKFGL